MHTQFNEFIPLEFVNVATELYFNFSTMFSSFERLTYVWDIKKVLGLVHPTGFHLILILVYFKEACLITPSSSFIKSSI